MSFVNERRTANPEYANASQLALWPETNAREAQDQLPELVRKLLLETPEAGQISIRTGNGVVLAGKDGVVNLATQTKLLPAGQIWFEFGTNKNSKRKATEDYDKAKGEASQDVTFVFVTVRRWQGKQSWAAERRAEKLFKDVLVLDADDLETWLQVAPATHLWISEILGLQPKDASTLETWWNRFSTVTKPTLPLSLFVAGRSKEAQQLRLLLSEEPRITLIQNEWVKDAWGFLYAALKSGDDKTSEPGAVIIVQSEGVWDRIVALPGPGVLVPYFDNADVARALDSGRHVVSIIDCESAKRRHVDIRLPRVGRDEAAEAFAGDNVNWHEADRLAVLARRSMPALVRTISLSPPVRQPTWSQIPRPDTLAALMLASRWTEQPDDLQILSELAAVSSEDLQQTIAEASRGYDPAIRRVQDVFVFTCLEEAFLELCDRVSSNLASRWEEIATRVLLEPDPYEKLGSQERISAQLKGQRITYSSALRHGFAESLALAGAIGSESSCVNLASSMVERIVRDVLHQVTSDSEGYTWSSIADVLPFLAEAAPDTFLSVLEDDLAASNPTVGCMFQAIEDPLALKPSSQHHHLLLALEVLCWSPDHLVRATQILTKLCRYDLPKNSGTNPLASISSVLCGWSRNTGADLATRLRALDACRIVNESIGWALLKVLWPDRGAYVFSPKEPHYRFWKPSSEQKVSSEWFDFTTGLVDRALKWVMANLTDLPWLVEALSRVSPDEANRIIEFLEREALNGDLDGDVRLTLFEQARETAARHTRFQNAEWAMEEEQRARLHKLAELLEPADDLRRFAYLFKSRPYLPGVDLNDYERYRIELEAKQREALDILLARSDAWEKLSEIVAHVETPTKVGWILSTYKSSDVLDPMLNWLESDSIALQQAAATWVGRHLSIDGPADLRRVLERGDVGNVALKRFVLNVPTASRFWEVLREFPATEDIFWSETPFEIVPYEDLTSAIKLLLERARAWSAIVIMSNGVVDPIENQEKHLPSATLILSVLRAALTQDPGEAGVSQMNGYYVGTLLDYLAETDVPVGDLAPLEFGYFRLLQHYREPHALNQVLASDPALFVDLVQRTYRGANEPHCRSESADPLAEHAWWVLDGWHGCPGLQEDGTLDQAAMLEWVKQARLKLSDLDRADIGDELIGQTFAQAPVDVDGIWPPIPVRNLFESIGSRFLEDGAIVGRLNSRGARWRGLYDGRSGERTLAEQYKQWSQTVQMQWPRTARILRKIAELHECNAVREDEQSQKYQDLG